MGSAAIAVVLSSIADGIESSLGDDEIAREWVTDLRNAAKDVAHLESELRYLVAGEDG